MFCSARLRKFSLQKERKIFPTAIRCQKNLQKSQEVHDFSTTCKKNRRTWGTFKILKDCPTEKIFLGRPKRRRENNIRIDLKEIGVSTRDRIYSPQDKEYWRAYVNALFINL